MQDKEQEDTERSVCKAFPDGIPHTILDGIDKHLAPVEGDGGVTFEKGERE